MTELDAALGLVKSGALVEFEIQDKVIEVSPDKENVYVKVKLQITGDEDVDPEEIVEWGAFGLIFLIAALSFNDARPRGNSIIDYVEDDQFNVADFLEGLTYRSDGLRFSADYVRGRSLKQNERLCGTGHNIP